MNENYYLDINDLKLKKINSKKVKKGFNKNAGVLKAGKTREQAFDIMFKELTKFYLTSEKFKEDKETLYEKCKKADSFKPLVEWSKDEK